MNIDLNFKDGTMNIIYMKGQICTLIGFDIEARQILKELINCIKDKEQDKYIKYTNI